MKQLFKTSTLALALCAMAGCTTIPRNNQVDFDQTVAKFKQAELSKTPAVTYENTTALSINSPIPVPRSILNKEIEVTFRERATLTDLANLLRPLGHYLYVDEALKDKEIQLPPNFKGRIGSLFAALQRVHGFAFAYNNYYGDDTISVTQEQTYLIRSLTKDEDLLTNIKKDLEALGAEDVSVSTLAGTITFKADFKEYDLIVDQLEQIKKGLSVVTVEMQVVNVVLNDDSEEGFDWNTLSLITGANAVDDLTSANLKDMVVNSITSNTGTSLKFAKSDFSASGVISFLKTYGKTTTEQNVTLETMSGKEVKLNSGKETPFIEEVGATTTNEIGTTTNSTRISKMNTGLDIAITPNFDHSSNNVQIELSFELSTLLGFIDLKAGDQLGVVSSPEKQQQTFNASLRVPAGKTAIVGGIEYESVSDNRNNIGLLSDFQTAHQSVKTQRNAMFILLRPTVRVFK